jgi:hypothetical protein
MMVSEQRKVLELRYYAVVEKVSVQLYSRASDRYLEGVLKIGSSGKNCKFDCLPEGVTHAVRALGLFKPTRKLRGILESSPLVERLTVDIVRP